MVSGTDFPSATAEVLPPNPGKCRGSYVLQVTCLLQFSDQLAFMSSTIITECAVLDGDARLQIA